MPEQPQTIGKYQIKKELGRGGMAVVYLARDPVLERDVAVKLMLNSIESNAELRERFLSEAKAVARIPQHPHIIPVHDLGYTEDGAPYIAMEYVHGADLEWRIVNDPPTFESKLEIVVQVLSGLAQAHAAGIVHRDIKPANIFITENGGAKIMDFGVARWAEHSKTHTGTMLGTPYYMSPEQIRADKSIDGRADVWSVGVILYRLLTGKLPFQADNFEGILIQVLRIEPPALVMPDGRQIPELQNIVAKALQKDRNIRYRDADAMARDLRVFAEKAKGQLPADTLLETVQRPAVPTKVLRESTIRRPPPPPPTAMERLLRGLAEHPIVWGLTLVATLGLGVLLASVVIRPPPSDPVTNGVTPPDFDASLNRAQEHLDAGRLVQALAVVQAVLDERSDEPRALDLKGQIESAQATALAAAEADAAERQRREAIEMAATSIREKIGQGSYARAASEIEAAESLYPDDPRWGELRRTADEAQSSAAVGAAVAAIQKKESTIRAAIRTRNFDGAANELAAAERDYPDQTQWAELRRDLERERADVEQERLRAEADRLVQQGNVALAAKRFDAAMNSFQSALEKNPSSTAAATGLESARQLEAAAVAAVTPPPGRVLTLGDPIFIPPPKGGFEGIDTGRTQVPNPGSVEVVLEPLNVRAGESYTLSVVVVNVSNAPLSVRSLEIVSQYGTQKTGEGVPLRPTTPVAQVGRVTVYAQAGEWHPRMDSGRVTVTVTLGGDKGTLRRTATWK